jgi:hypothetical protein
MIGNGSVFRANKRDVPLAPYEWYALPKQAKVTFQVGCQY